MICLIDGTTQCKWDNIIPLNDFVVIDGKSYDFDTYRLNCYKKGIDYKAAESYFDANKKIGLWSNFERVTKDNGAIVLFGAEPFSSLLRNSNKKNFKYDWIWVKDKSTGHLNAKKQPMRKTEIISVFYRKQCTYIPQITPKDPKNIRPATKVRKNIDNYGSMNKVSERGIPENMSYPQNLLNFRGCFGDKGKSFHPTQKPADLLEYLIKTYMIEGETVLDCCMGSGSTGVACVNTNRKFVGIEKEQKYFDIACRRIEDTRKV